MQVFKSTKAAKQLDKLDIVTRQRLTKEIAKLKDWPDVSNIKALTGEYKGLYRLRVGDWRVLFRIKDDVIQVAEVWNRKEAY